MACTLFGWHTSFEEHEEVPPTNGGNTHHWKWIRCVAFPF